MKIRRIAGAGAGGDVCGDVCGDVDGDAGGEAGDTAGKGTDEAAGRKMHPVMQMKQQGERCTL